MKIQEILNVHLDPPQLETRYVVDSTMNQQVAANISIGKIKKSGG